MDIGNKKIIKCVSQPPINFIFVPFPSIIEVTIPLDWLIYQNGC